MPTLDSETLTIRSGARLMLNKRFDTPLKFGLVVGVVTICWEFS